MSTDISLDVICKLEKLLKVRNKLPKLLESKFLKSKKHSAQTRYKSYFK